MSGRDIIEMSVRELKRLSIIQKAIEGHITQKTAAAMTGISERQLRRVIRAVRKEGDRGVVHKLRGKTSNRKASDTIKAKVLKLYTKKYQGFGPTLFAEKLSEVEGIEASKESVRKWLIEAGLWTKRRKRSSHRQWRQRKECLGAMVQMDGSHHDWLEGRGPVMVLMGYIDDATNTVFGRFYDYEGTFPAMDSFKQYIRKYGLPQSVYLDKHTTYKSWAKLTDEEIMAGVEEPMSQFERALNELGVEVIHAHSPEAKGRVERLFGVLQDRLVKEMRLRGIRTKEEANSFLHEYLPQHNRKFRRVAANSADMHREVPHYCTLNTVLSIRTERTPKRDNTITHHGKLYLIEDCIRTKKVILEERLDGTMHIMSNGTSLKYREVEERPKVCSLKPKRAKRATPSIPSPDHPWRKWQDKDALPKRKIFAYA